MNILPHLIFKTSSYVKQKWLKWVIIVHGYAEEGKLYSRKALHFYNMGYNVLVLI